MSSEFQSSFDNHKIEEIQPIGLVSVFIEKDNNNGNFSNSGRCVFQFLSFFSPCFMKNKQNMKYEGMKLFYFFFKEPDRKPWIRDLESTSWK